MKAEPRFLTAHDGGKYSSQFLYYIQFMLFFSKEEQPLGAPPVSARSAASETILHRRSLISLDRRLKRAIDAAPEIPSVLRSVFNAGARANRRPILLLIPFATLIRLDANLNL
jgi:hypothetical protein